MLNLTVKTMDSRSRNYSVAENTTIKDFKTTIAADVNVQPERQRLIYQGRVLSDDFKLTKEHDGKVLHLVQRIPISATTVASSTTSNTTTQAQPTQNQNPNIFPANHLAQVFQQALGSLGNVMAGGNGAAPVISGTVLSTDGSGGSDQAMNFHIEVGPTSIHPQPPPTTSAAAAASASAPPNPTIYSAPRQQLDKVKHMLTHLNEALTELENKNQPMSVDGSTPPSGATPEFTEGGQTEVVCAGENEPAPTPAETEPPVDVNPTPTTSTSTTSSDSSQPGRARNTHPSLKEVGQVYKDVMKAEQRLTPFLEYMSNFLEEDPPFTSTESEEFQSTSRRLSVILKAQRLLSHIHLTLSNIAIPLGRTPPRSMLVRAPTPTQGIRRHAVPMHPPPAMAPPGPRGPHPARPMPWVGISAQQAQRPGHPPATQIRMERLSAPVGPGGFQPPLLFFPRPNMPGPQPQRSGAPGAPAGPQTRTTAPPQAPAAPVSQSQTAPTPAVPVSNVAPTGQQVTVDPPLYNIEVNASIQPYIHISVNNQEGGQANQAPTVARISRNEFDLGTLPPFIPAATSAQTTRSRETGTVPGLPSVTGADAENLRNFVRHHAQRCIMEGMQQASGTQNINNQSGNQPDAGVQIASDISSVISDAVNSAVYNHLSGGTTVTPVATSAPSQRTTSTTNTTPDQSTTTKPPAEPSKPTPSEPTFTRASTLTPTPSKPTIVKSATKQAGSSSSPTPMVVDEAPKDKGSGDSDKDKKLSASGLRKIMTGGGFGSKSSPKHTAHPQTSKSSGKEQKMNPKEVMEIINDEIRSRGPLESPQVTIPPPTIEERARDIIANMTYDMPVPVGTTVSMNDLARQMGYDFPSVESPKPNIPEKIMILVGEEVTNDEMYEYFRGDIRPLNKIRNALRRFLSKEFFNGATPTRNDIKMATEILSESYRPTVENFFRRARTNKNYDIVKSNLALHRHFVQNAMECIFLSSDAKYTKALDHEIRFAFAAWVKINESILDGHRVEFAQLLLHTDDISTKMRDPLAILCLGMLRPDDRETHPLLLMLDAMARFVKVPSSELNKFMIPAPKYLEEHILSDLVLKGDGTVTIEPKNASSKSSSANDVPTTSSSSTTSPLVPADKDWKKEVPSEWVETIVGDMEKQKTMSPQKPFSDAYMAGMPASKRRKVVS